MRLGIHAYSRKGKEQKQAGAASANDRLCLRRQR